MGGEASVYRSVSHQYENCRGRAVGKRTSRPARRRLRRLAGTFPCFPVSGGCETSGASRFGTGVGASRPVRAPGRST